MQLLRSFNSTSNKTVYAAKFSPDLKYLAINTQSHLFNIFDGRSYSLLANTTSWYGASNYNSVISYGI